MATGSFGNLFETPFFDVTAGVGDLLALPATVGDVAGTITLQSISLWCSVASGTASVALGLYTDNGGKPDTLVGRVAAFNVSAITTTSYTRPTITNPVLTANTNYWIVVLSRQSSGVALRVRSNGGIADYLQHGGTADSLPASFGTANNPSPGLLQYLKLWATYEAIVTDTITIDSNAIILATEQGTILSDATIQIIDEIPILSDAHVTLTDTQTINSDATIQIIDEIPILSDAHVRTTDTQTVNSDATIQIIDEISILSDAEVTGIEVDTVDINSNAHIQTTELVDIGADASILKTNSTARLSDALVIPLDPPTVYTQLTSNAHIAGSTSQTITSDAYIISAMSNASKTHSRLRQTQTTAHWNKRTGIEIF